MQRLSEQVAVVTGGAQGLGGATARRLAGEGARVLIADIDLPTAEANAERIRSQGGEAQALAIDVSKHGDIKAMVKEAVDRWGRLDILVNNAFNVFDATSGGAVEVTEEDWDDGMNVLLKAIFLGVKYAVPEMRKAGGGSIVNLSSVHGLLVSPGYLVYETAKAAVIGATRQMATEFGPAGIRGERGAAGTRGHRAAAGDVGGQPVRPAILRGPVSPEKNWPSGGYRQRDRVSVLRRGFVHHRPFAGRRWRAQYPASGELRRSPSALRPGKPGPSASLLSRRSAADRSHQAQLHGGQQE